MDTKHNDLVTENIPLVYALIRKYYPRWIADDDIVQAGMLGLCRAADTYNESLGRFPTYAAKVIINHIRHEFRRRCRHKTVISLSSVIGEDYDDGDAVTLEDIIPGDDDIDFIDMDGCLSLLDEREKRVVGLKQIGYNATEISKELGVSRQTICDICRRIKIKWSKVI